MTMDEKIAFWRQVMQYARDRGIDVYVFTWNIFVKGTENSGYGLTTDPANATTKDWVRRATRTLFDTYPLLAGIGVTAGENMGSLERRREGAMVLGHLRVGRCRTPWPMRRTRRVRITNTNRVIRLIHRAHQADLNQIISYFQTLCPATTNADSTLAFSFKYSQAHMHSSTKPLFINQGGWFNTIPAGKKTWLTVRNDDLYYMRWGDPDFARAYMTNLPDVSKIAGFYMGPDGNCWGRDYVSTEPESPPQQVIDKMWYSFLLWGRLSYDPTLPNSQFQAILGEDFPQSGRRQSDQLVHGLGVRLEGLSAHSPGSTGVRSISNGIPKRAGTTRRDSKRCRSSLTRVLGSHAVERRWRPPAVDVHQAIRERRRGQRTSQSRTGGGPAPAIRR